jgi:hypothetical protein
MRALLTTPKARLEAFRLLRVFGRKPVTFEKFREFRAAPFANMLETEIYWGRSAFTRARNDGAPAEPIEGPAKT